jgi:8-oxo-dGTP diphosphatase
VTKSRLIVSCLVRDGDRYLFITQNKPGGAYPDTLHIPGGGLEDGESPAEGAAREVREEVGLEITNVEAFDFDWDIVDYKGEPTQLVFLRFTADRLSGEAIAGSDAKEAIWVDRSELADHPHNPPSQRLLRKLGLIGAS